MTEWYADDDFWARIYPVLFSPELFAKAATEIDHVIALTGVRQGHALDLCCGPGRHAVPLARRGFDVTGVDLSKYLLGEATRRASAEGVRVEWVEQDMRSFARPGHYDLVLNLFTSFGYFSTEAEDMRALKNMVESLADGGTIVIDTLGKEALAERLHADSPPVEERDGALLIQRVKVVDDWCRVKTEWIIAQGDRVDRVHFEHTLFSGKELRELMHWAGLSDVALYGDVDGRPYGPGARRLVAVGRR
ncbi:MAG: class I SAM-dependent methyltransferase [Deltaproteobacteria bacterium]|nr:class I SAM-dependent methyltransferase [Deltaproteobacteria bacterium]MBK8236685.1 class I SAM-dependent methyltransferase [Deltaproteobacteria bacterium]MBP7288740.1 class I SAM-dependent methyltransferase [Nannocystaceae bacterium]